MKLRLVAALSITLAGCPSAGGSRPCGSFDLPQAEDWSTVTVIGETATFDTLEERSGGYLFSFDGRDPIASHGLNSNSNGSDSGALSAISSTKRVLTDVDIGESRYALAVEVFFSDPDFLRDRVPDGALPISGVVFAKGAGLVRFDTADGQRFIRVGPARP